MDLKGKAVSVETRKARGHLWLGEPSRKERMFLGEGGGGIFSTGPATGNFEKKSPVD